MNLSPSSLARRLVVVAGLFAAVAGAAQGDFAAADPAVLLSENQRVAHGTHRDDVSVRLGPPDEIVSTGIWVYWNFQVKGSPQPVGLDTLVVFFARDRVTALRLTERKATLALLQRLRQQQALGGTTIASAR